MLVNVWFEFPDHHPAPFQLIAYSAFLNPSLDSTITRTVTVLNTFTSFDAPLRDVCGWSHMVEHALRMRGVVRHLHDG